MLHKIQSLAFSIMGTMLSFLLIGKLLDIFLKTDIFITIFLILGFLLSMFYSYYQIKLYVTKRK